MPWWTAWPAIPPMSAPVMQPRASAVPVADRTEPVRMAANQNSTHANLLVIEQILNVEVGHRLRHLGSLGRPKPFESLAADENSFGDFNRNTRRERELHDDTAVRRAVGASHAVSDTRQLDSMRRFDKTGVEPPASMTCCRF